METNYIKYLKYKTKYVEFKKHIGGAKSHETVYKIIRIAKNEDNIIFIEIERNGEKEIFKKGDLIKISYYGGNNNDTYGVLGNIIINETDIGKIPTRITVNDSDRIVSINLNKILTIILFPISQ